MATVTDTGAVMPATDPLQDSPAASTTNTQSPPKPKRPPRPNYGRIHAKPIPYEVFPLPAFVPHNPLSLLRIIQALVSEFFTRPQSRPQDLYIGYFSSQTRSVHVTNPKHARALWEMGFFGKGTLSRSEPSWLEREEARRIAGAGGTSEENTSARREERRLFKLERARVEREAIEEQLRMEGKLDGRAVVATKANGNIEVKQEADTAVIGNGHAVKPVEGHGIGDGVLQDDQSEKHVEAASNGNVLVAEDDVLPEKAPSMQPVELPKLTEEETDDASITNKEHLQLSLYEAFFLSYGLGVLRVIDSTDASAQSSTPALLTLFARHATFPPSMSLPLRPDNDFLLTYAVYHHYRSLGWVTRSGSKFAVDFLLYNRGPVFSHAEFSIVIVPEYPDGWQERWGSGTLRDKKTKWWEMHCTNRIQNQVIKTMVLCYVTVPVGLDWDGQDVGKVLRSYRIRDFAVRRWLANRSRD